jgi:hypothetical protein
MKVTPNQRNLTQNSASSGLCVTKRKYLTEIPDRDAYGQEEVDSIRLVLGPAGKYEDREGQIAEEPEKWNERGNPHRCGL